MPVVVIKIEGIINTDYSGLKKLYEFYHECNEYTNIDISIDLYHLQWIDANLSALFESILYKLTTENNISFSTDYKFLKSSFDILFRNGFIKGAEAQTNQKASYVKAENFLRDDKEGFNTYIKNNLMGHVGMPTLNDELYERISCDLFEIFANYHHHSNTTLPFFVAGQWYPKLNKLKFTMVDLGEGFLKKISQVTNGDISTHAGAIRWALEKGNTVKYKLENVSGGLGISSIYDYCKNNNGELDIVTGSHYWSSTYDKLFFKDGRPLSDKNFAGSLINLTFQH